MKQLKSPQTVYLLGLRAFVTQSDLIVCTEAECFMQIVRQIGSRIRRNVTFSEWILIL